MDEKKTLCEKELDKVSGGMGGLNELKDVDPAVLQLKKPLKMGMSDEGGETPD